MLGIEIAGVLSNHNSNFGTDYNIRDLVERFDVPFFEDLDDILTLKDIDYLISVQYHLILKQAHIDVAKKLAINLHMAPLPEYRGCNQFSFAIYNQARIFGATLHRLESGIDNGNIISEVRFEIPENATVKILYEMTFAKSLTLFIENIGSIFEGNFSLTPQESLFKERGTNIYYRKDILKLKQLSLADNEDELIRKVRSTSMPGFEPPFILHKGIKYFIIPEEIYNKNL
jgi:methionyl-tRNA formyltransferase